MLNHSSYDVLSEEDSSPSPLRMGSVAATSDEAGAAAAPPLTLTSDTVAAMWDPAGAEASAVVHRAVLSSGEVKAPTPNRTESVAAMWDEAGATAAAVVRQCSVKRESSTRGREPAQRYGTAPAGWSGWAEAPKSAAIGVSRQASRGAAAGLPPRPAVTDDAPPAAQGSSDAIWFAGLPVEEPSPHAGILAPHPHQLADGDAVTAPERLNGEPAASKQPVAGPAWEHSGRITRRGRENFPPLILARSSFGLSQRKLSTFDAFALTLETMWGVIIFLKFGELVMEARFYLYLFIHSSIFISISHSSYSIYLSIYLYLYLCLYQYLHLYLHV